MENHYKLAFFLPPLQDGGLERTTLCLAGEFARRGHRVEVVAVHAAGPFAEQVADQVTLIDLGKQRALAALPGLVRYLRTSRPEVLISAQYYINILASWAVRRSGVACRLIATERLASSSDLALLPIHRRHLLPLLMRRAYRHADAVLAVSRGSAHDLAALLKIPPDDVATIYNPTVTERVRTGRNRTPNHPWLQQRTAPVVLAAGRLAPQKDFPTLLRAFALLRQRTSARLVILGEGPDRAMLLALADELGVREHVSLPGFADDPHSDMAAADLFVLSSRYEGMPNALIEALAAGAPAISTDCPSGPAEILPPEALVPVGDHHALARAAAAVLERPDLRRKIHDYAQPILRQFTPEVCCARYLEVIERCMHDH